MNDTTPVTGIVLALLVISLSLSAQAVEAADMDDVTLQILESNDPSDIVNNIELPEIDSVYQSDEIHDNSHESTHDVDENVHDIRDEVEDDIDDAKDDIEDSLEEAEEESDDPEEPDD